MPYPFPSFGDFVFQTPERALDGLGGVWEETPQEARSRAQGAVSDNVVLLNIGSSTRHFDCYLSPARFDELKALRWTTAVLTDWDRPTPNSRVARLDAVDYQTSVASGDDDVYGGTQRRILCTVRFSSQ